MGIGIGLILLYFYPSAIGLRAYIPKLIVVGPIIALISVFLVLYTPARSERRFDELKDPVGAETFQMRLTIWEANVSLWKRSPIVGWGPAKTRMEGIVDNEWILLARRYGMLGITAFICWFASIARTLSRIREQCQTSEMTAFTIALQAAIPASGAYMVAASIYHSLQLMPLMLLLFGAAFSQLGAHPELLVSPVDGRARSRLQFGY